MWIDHVAMYVHGLESMRDFYVTYFDAKANHGYHNSKTGLSTYFLQFENGSRLELMHRPHMEGSVKTALKTGYIHLAFRVGSKEAVHAKTEQLRAAGFTVYSEPRTTGDGYFESCVLDPEENMIEIIE